MTRKEKYYLFLAIQTILDRMKFRPLLDKLNAEEYNKELDEIIKFLEELKGKNHD